MTRFGMTSSGPPLYKILAFKFWLCLDPCDPTGAKDCVVTGTDRLCICNVGYWGDKCEQSGCSPDPCQNKADCEPVLAISADTNNFVCTCKDTSYFIGETCDESHELEINLKIISYLNDP